MLSSEVKISFRLNHPPRRNGRVETDQKSAEIAGLNDQYWPAGGR
jgi:hypothetical protein